MPNDHAGRSIFHIVHFDHIGSIVDDFCLWSDAEMRGRETGTTIGIDTIKARRLELPVKTCRRLAVGECVPFYFCPRSVMLYVIYKGNHPSLTYHGGQRPIVHLEANLDETIAWAEARHRHWSVSLSNAGAKYAQFRTGRRGLDDVDWASVAATDFRPPEVKEAKQAEFLVEKSFPWELVRRVGVIDHVIAEEVGFAMRGAAHRPKLEVRREWYY